MSNLNRTVTPSEIETLMKSLPTKTNQQPNNKTKSPGPDGFISEFYQTSKKELMLFRVHWDSTEMLDMRRFRKVVVSYVIYSPLVKQMLNSWTTWNRIISQDWRHLVTAVLEAGP